MTRLRYHASLGDEWREAQIFIAVMGASNFTYVEATWTQRLPIGLVPIRAPLLNSPKSLGRNDQSVRRLLENYRNDPESIEHRAASGKRRKTRACKQCRDTA